MPFLPFCPIASATFFVTKDRAIEKSMPLSHHLDTTAGGYYLRIQPWCCISCIPIDDTRSNTRGQWRSKLARGARMWQSRHCCTACQWGGWCVRQRCTALHLQWLVSDKWLCHFCFAKAMRTQATTHLQMIKTWVLTFSYIYKTLRSAT